MSGESPKEFWIEEFKGCNPPTLTVFNELPDFSKLKIRIKDGEPELACEYFHVIEFSAYEKMKEVRDNYAEQLVKYKQSDTASTFNEAYIERDATKAPLTELKVCYFHTSGTASSTPCGKCITCYQYEMVDFEDAMNKIKHLTEQNEHLKNMLEKIIAILKYKDNKNEEGAE